MTRLQRRWIVASLLVVASSGARGEISSGPIVVRNAYWAKEGMEEAVYRHRLYASEVRARLGLYVGRVLRSAGAADGQPDVVWECEYPSVEAREADLRALGDSGEFEPVLEKMGTLIENFERTVWRVAREPFPDLLRLGRGLEDARPLLSSACGRLEEMRYTEAQAAPFHEQTQFDCYGLPVFGGDRKAELMFNEGVLGFIWVLVNADELERLEAELAHTFGPVVFSDSTDRIFASGTVALRNDPPEILIATEELMTELTRYRPGE